MPSSHRKKRSVLFDKSPKILGEVTLNDYANSQIPKGSKGRIKKAITNELKMAQKSIEEPLEEIVNDDTEEVKVVNRRRRRRKSSSCKDDDIDSRPGKFYPLDLWFLLSEYIRPEDVLKFALLCKGSYHVVNTSKFWISLYKRYCKSERVPKDFGVECLKRRHGLKPAVVQALFFAHPSLNQAAIIHDPSSLSGFQCILMWIERTSQNDIEDSVRVNTPKCWIYKFKLLKKEYQYRSSNTSDKLSCCDINANPDEGCRILTVPCWEYTAVPCVCGMRLCEVVSSSRQLSLIFSSSPLNSSTSQMGNISIRLRPSQGPTVLDWWHPSYRVSYPSHSS